MDERTYRIKIDLAQGLFEAEGSESFVKESFENFKAVIKDKQTPFIAPVNEEKGANRVSSKKASGGRKTSRISSFSIVKDLNLRQKDQKSLKDFFKEKSPATNIENNAVFVYYLEKILGINNITVDHIFTCYKEAGSRIPGNLKQSIVDTASSRYGYLDGRDMQNIKVAVFGENLVEHDLPKTVKEPKKK